jgi:2-oxoglutarate ferredoxin oxidoreductase subunit delta
MTASTTEEQKESKKSRGLGLSDPIIVYRKWCKGCGICIAYCPEKVLEPDSSGKATVAHPQNCTLCKQCELRCPDFAICLQYDAKDVRAQKKEGPSTEKAKEE